ncbi:MAG: twin-arginine translocase subunit TatC [Bacteroidales bacterium]|nr:twin-arginine translocase subunit TatC [Bacteroidales bacterium]
MSGNQLLTFGGHLEVLRKMLFRIIVVMAVISVTIFCFKDVIFEMLLAPSNWDFVTYRWAEHMMNVCGIDFHFNQYEVKLIATGLSSQFMTHITTSIYLGLLLCSPYILFELFKFISPALYDNEKKYSYYVVVSIYILFVVGVLMNYFIVFPIAFRFLGTYQVNDSVISNITIDSYISSFTSLTLVMGLVFQLPTISFFLAKMHVLSSSFMKTYRKHALIICMIVSAIITPPDIMTLILVSVPLYFLYEVSIWVVTMTK